jgi:hypothetical protein
MFSLLEPGMELLVKTTGEEVRLELHRAGVLLVPQVHTPITEGTRAGTSTAVPITSNCLDQQFPMAWHEEVFGDTIPPSSQHLVPPTQFHDAFSVLPPSSLDDFRLMQQSWLSPIIFCDPQASEADSLLSSSTTPEDMDSTYVLFFNMNSD